jgi:hypothetical protein
VFAGLQFDEHVPVPAVGAVKLSGFAAGAIPVVGGFGVIEPEPVLMYPPAMPIAFADTEPLPVTVKASEAFESS